jgi:hypothetical protein
VLAKTKKWKDDGKTKMNDKFKRSSAFVTSLLSNWTTYVNNAYDKGKATVDSANIIDKLKSVCYASFVELVYSRTCFLICRLIV